MGNTMEQGTQPAKTKRPSRWIKSTKRFRKDRKGVAAVEMALVAWPFLAIMFAILEQGIVFFAEFALEHNVADAARQIRTGQVDSDTLTAAQFRDTLVCPGITMLFTCSDIVVDVRTFVTFDDIDGNLPEPVNDQNEMVALNGWDSGAELSVMVVRTFYEWNTLTPSIFTKMDNLGNGNRLIAATNTFRNEPFGS